MATSIDWSQVDWMATVRRGRLYDAVMPTRPDILVKLFKRRPERFEEYICYKYQLLNYDWFE